MNESRSAGKGLAGRLTVFSQLAKRLPLIWGKTNLVNVFRV